MLNADVIDVTPIGIDLDELPATPDRVVEALGRKLSEVPVGFKWFVEGLFSGTYCFGGEESAGASFLRRDGTVWTTDKDGLILDLLAAEITARTGRAAVEELSMGLRGLGLEPGEQRFVLKFYPPIPITGDTVADTQALYRQLARRLASSGAPDAATTGD